MKSSRSLAESVSLKSPICVLSLIVAVLSGSLVRADTRGEQLYRNCTICHNPDAQGIPLQKAPALSGLSEKYILEQLKKYKSGIRGKHPDDVAGLRMLPMAQTLASEEDMKAVASHIAELPSTSVESSLEGGNATNGQALYAVCQACHGPDGKGNDLLNAPSLLNQYDWYQLTQLKNFKSGIRGTNPQDITGAQMRPMSMILADEQAMKDVIAYIQTLSQ
ncbi:MAG: cytochrome c [Opitutales bacterium]|nr:cytochrome c [Opitutales bacterium]